MLKRVQHNNENVYDPTGTRSETPLAPVDAAQAAPPHATHCESRGSTAL